MKHMEHVIKIFISKFSQHWLHSLHYKWKNTGFTFNSKTKTLNVFIVLWALLKEILKWHETLHIRNKLHIPNKLTFRNATFKFWKVDKKYFKLHFNRAKDKEAMWTLNLTKAPLKDAKNCKAHGTCHSCL